MGIEVIATLIARYGLPLAYRMWQDWTNGVPVTQAMWDDLLKLGEQSAKTQLIDALNRAGIPLDDPRAVALIALLPAP